MPEKVLIYSRFPKALMVRIGQRFDLMDAAGKPPNEMFSAEQLSSVMAPVMTASIWQRQPGAASPSATVRPPMRRLSPIWR